MGVPSLYQWLVKKYPKIVVTEAKGMEFDNLYLDMNEIIHTCVHPGHELFSPTTFDEVCQRISIYIDEIFHTVKPKKLLYLAIDGVAPRAKMNQQRSRRFRAARDEEISETEEDRLRRKFELEGKMVLPKISSEVSDTNIITPGTEFMYNLSKALQIYIRLRLNTELSWKKITVILSDSNVPGEDEHKIINFIRLQRNQKGYDPNTRHCLYGRDVDLIMLALSTREVHFSILREDTRQASKVCLSEGVSGSVERPYELVNMWTLRDYLELDMKIPDPPFEIDLERIIDDFIFISFFIGNDFLPPMPSLEVKEDAMDLMMDVYRNEFRSRGGYLVDMKRIEDNKNNYVDLIRIEKFMLSLGKYEERIFKKRIDLGWCTIKKAPKKLSNDPLVQAPIGSLKINGSNQTFSNNDKKNVLKNTINLKQQLKDFMREKSDLRKQGGLEMDKIRLDLPGWKERYYKEKFSAEISEDIENIRKEVVQKYIEGLCWIVQYYFFGVQSWNWFYPYHYGPFASDFKGLAGIVIKFNTGAPFKPFDQLMGVLPPKSVDCLPKSFRHLMIAKRSLLKGLYPNDFEVDTDGKRYLWQGIVKLPFINEEALFSEQGNYEKNSWEMN